VAISRNNNANNGTLSNTGSATTLTTSWDTSLLKLGDRVFCFLSSIATNPTLTAPVGGGWTQLGSLYKPTTTLATAVFYKDYVAEAASTTHTWTFSAAGRCIAELQAYSGCDLSQAPLSGNNATLTSGVSVSGSSAVTDGDWVLNLAAGRQSPGDAAAITWASTTGTDNESFDLRASATGTTPQLTAVFTDVNMAQPTGTTTRTLTASKTLAEAHIWAVRLRAAAAAAGWRVGMPVR